VKDECLKTPDNKCEKMNASRVDNDFHFKNSILLVEI
jgi:hypothetical protein